MICVRFVTVTYVGEGNDIITIDTREVYIIYLLNTYYVGT